MFMLPIHSDMYGLTSVMNTSARLSVICPIVSSQIRINYVRHNVYIPEYLE